MEHHQSPTFNRSFTKSEPNLLNCRQVNVTELIHHEGNDRPMIRQYSYRELRRLTSGRVEFGEEFCSSPVRSFNNSPFRDEFVFTRPQPFLRSPTLSVKFEENCGENDAFKLHNDSPMDVDQSGELGECLDDSVIGKEYHGKSLDITSLQEDKESSDKGVNKTEEIKKITKKGSRNLRKENMNPNYSQTMYLLISVFMSLIAIFVYFNNRVSLNDISPVNVEQDLKTHVFNQNHIVDTLLFNLNRLHSTSNYKKMLVFVGSTGVGKTYILNILQNQYKSDRHIELNYVLHKDIVDGKKNISHPNRCFILSIDNLRIDNVEVVRSYFRSLSNDCVLVIPVFNIQDTSNNLDHVVRVEYFKDINNFFSNNIPSSHTLLFNVMNHDNLETWVKAILKGRGIDSEKNIEFIKTLIENHNVGSYGFKGVIPKVNLLPE